MASNVYLLFLIFTCKNADVIDPLAVQLEQRGRYSGFGGVLATILFLSRCAGSGSNGAVDRLSPVSDSDVNGADQASFSFSKRNALVLFYGPTSMNFCPTFLHMINVEMAFPPSIIHRRCATDA